MIDLSFYRAAVFPGGEGCWIAGVFIRIRTREAFAVKHRKWARFLGLTAASAASLCLGAFLSYQAATQAESAAPSSEAAADAALRSPPPLRRCPRPPLRLPLLLRSSPPTLPSPPSCPRPRGRWCSRAWNRTPRRSFPRPTPWPRRSSFGWKRSSSRISTRRCPTTTSRRPPIRSRFPTPRRCRRRRRLCSMASRRRCRRFVRLR